MRGFCCLCCLLASTGAAAGPDERVRVPTTAAPIRQPLNLDLSEHLEPSERIPAVVISPIFRTYLEPMASGQPEKNLRTNADELAGEQLIRAMEQQAQAASGNSFVCLNRQGNDSTGGGVSWSLNDGFGFYLQGKGFKQLQRLMKHNDICPPGDPSPVCKTMPKRTCD